MDWELVREDIRRAAQYAKIGRQTESLISKLPLPKLYERWKGWRAGVYPNIKLEVMDANIHGVCRIRQGNPYEIAVNLVDPNSRRVITAIHEALHQIEYPVQSDHDCLHFLAVILGTDTFPSLLRREQKGVGAMPDLWLRDEEEALGDTDVATMTDEEEDDAEYEFDEETGLYRRKKKNPFSKLGKVANKLFNPMEQFKMVKKMVKGPKGKVVRKAKSAGPAAAKAIVENPGWVVPYLITAYESQSFVAAIKGIKSISPQHNMAGFVAPSFDDFFRSIKTSLDIVTGGGLYGFAKAVAAGGAATNPALGATVGAFGLRVVISYAHDAARLDPILMDIFSQAGAQSQDVVITPDERNVEFIAVHVTDEKGKGYVQSLVSQAVSIADGGILAGTAVSIFPLNRRDLNPGV